MYTRGVLVRLRKNKSINVMPIISSPILVINSNNNLISPHPQPTCRPI